MKRVIIKYDAGYSLNADAFIWWQPKSVAIDMLDDIAENVVEKQGKSRYIEGPYHNGRGSCPVMEIIMIASVMTHTEKCIIRRTFGDGLNENGRMAKPYEQSCIAICRTRE